ncbi:FkbM family methyltransferase [Chitiniphilus purpureus]|uniref:FkbM family methyltransferase n=1 Tax=Chitiniphilus purpureus TaxID=2981137 RepID=A0ABY6DQ57_9NEIS|nr:FkbM family methyltransferase [Chitiniphilus sp. CD1]UXY15611.1 FkbM family methyltransferase [Chitiniphilus sp. CD1]
MNHALQLLLLLTANHQAQRILSRLTRAMQYLQGIGAGSEAATSGEVAVLRCLPSHDEQSVCVFDVGANQGQFLELVMAELGDRHKEIHCFEPSSTAFTRLSRFAADKKRVFLNQCALHESGGHARLFSDRPGSGLASLSQRRLDHYAIEFVESETVQLMTLDDYCTSHKIEYIDLLKLDTEGHELSVLRGASKMLGQQAIARISFEFGGCNIDSRSYFQDFWYLLTSFGYQLFRITPSGHLEPLTRYSEELEQFRTTNYFAVITNSTRPDIGRQGQ